jgi:hypothetical protein
VIDVQTMITSIHDTSRHDTIVNVMFSFTFHPIISFIGNYQIRHPDTASSLMCDVLF